MAGDNVCMFIVLYLNRGDLSSVSWALKECGRKIAMRAAPPVHHAHHDPIINHQPKLLISIARSYWWLLENILKCISYFRFLKLWKRMVLQQEFSADHSFVVYQACPTAQPRVQIVAVSLLLPWHSPGLGQN